MLVAERHREIISIIEREGSIRVTELARLFQVTEETIRRDLDKLESEGKLERSHGGAVRIQSNGTEEIPFPQREISNVEEKTAIATEAVKLVQEGDTIILDGSTTAGKMAELLPDVSLTVLTNSLKVALELSNRPNITLIVNGGLLSSASLSCLGPHAERFMEEYHVDKMFFSCQGVDFDRGLSDSNEWLASLKRKMLSIAYEKYLLVDHSKFNVNAFTVFSQLRDVDYVITDNKTEDGVLRELSNVGVKHIIATML